MSTTEQQQRDHAVPCANATHREILYDYSSHVTFNADRICDRCRRKTEPWSTPR